MQMGNGHTNDKALESLRSLSEDKEMRCGVILLQAQLVVPAPVLAAELNVLTRTSGTPSCDNTEVDCMRLRVYARRKSVANIR